MDAASVISLCGRFHVRYVIKVPAEFRLIVKTRFFQTADRRFALVPDQPGNIFFSIRHHFTDLPLNVAHTFIDRAEIIQIRIVCHHRIRNTMRELMRNHIQTLGKIIRVTGKEQGPAQIIPDESGIIHLDMIFILKIVQDHDWCSEAVTADPTDGLVIIISAAVIIKRKQPDLIPS